MSASNTQNDFSKGSIVKNIMNLAIPMTLAQLINVLYNIVDRIYIGRIPDHATLSLTGIGLSLPIITLVIAFANLFGMGGAPLCSIERGRGDIKEAEAIMGNSFSMMVISGMLLTVLCLIFRKPMLYLFGASDATYPYADAYITIYLLGSLFVMVGLGLSGFTMAITNCTVQIMCNATLQVYGGDLYVGVMTVINSIREIATLPVTGVTHSAQPVLGFNYGAKEYGRVKKAIVFTSFIAILYTTGIWLIVDGFPAFFIRIFNQDAELIAAGIPAIRLYFFGFFMMSLQFSGQSIFVGLGESKKAIFFSIFRKVIIVVPLTILLPGMFGMGTNGVFAAEPISNFIGGIACFGTMLFTIWRKLTKLQKQEAV